MAKLRFPFPISRNDELRGGSGWQRIERSLQKMARFINSGDDAITAAVEAAEAAQDAAETAASTAMSGTPDGYADVLAGIASYFSTSDTYYQGDFCFKDSKLYRFIKDHDQTAWSAGDVELASISAIITLIQASVINDSVLLSDNDQWTKNLINPSTITSGYILNNNTPTQSSNFWYSDYIKINEGTVYYRDAGASVSGLMHCYDVNKRFIGEVDRNTDGYQRITDFGDKPSAYYILQPLPGTVYIRVNGRYTSKLMLTQHFYPSKVIAYNHVYKNNMPSIAFFGDSITLGTNGTTSELSPKPFPAWFEELTGFAVTNKGAGSVGWVSTEYSDTIAYDLLSDDTLTNYDVIALCFGVNDSAATMGNYDSSDETTIMGQVNKCIKYIGAQNPNARIIIIAPWNGRKYGSFPNWRYAVTTSGGFKRSELSDELKKAANYYYIGFISQEDSPINGFGLGTVNNAKTGPYLGTDDVHPTDAGYKAIGEWLAAKIQSIIH